MNLLEIFFLFCLLCLGYYFRIKLFYHILVCAWKIYYNVNLLYLTIISGKLKRVNFSTYSNFNVHEFEICLKNKFHRFFLFEDENNKLNTFVNDTKKLERKLQNKNSIIHCCLIDNKENYILDFTSDMSKCLFYLDKDGDSPKIKWKFLIDHILQSNSIQVEKKDLIVYMSLHNIKLSEITYKVSDIYENYINLN